MAKPQKRKMRPNWFQKQVEMGGQDFLLRKQPSDIQREAFNIIRDICRNNVGPKDYEYLFNMKILSNIKIAFYNKYIECHTYDSALSFVLQSPNGAQMLEQNYGVAADNLQKVFNDTRNLLTAYCVILQSIDSMIGFVQTNYTKSEEDYEQLYSSVQYQVSRFRYII